MIDFDSVKDELHLRNIIGKCLRKDIQQPYTTTAVSLIKKATDDHDGTVYAELDDLVKDQEVLKDLIAECHNYIFVGKAGSFCPVKPGLGGGILVREQNGKFNAATGTKGFRWREGETLLNADRMDLIDMGYFEALAITAKATIMEYGDFDQFASLDPAEPMMANQKLMLTEHDISELSKVAAKKKGEPDAPPWLPPCGDSESLKRSPA